MTLSTDLLTQYPIAQQQLSAAMQRALTKACTRFVYALRAQHCYCSALAANPYVYIFNRRLLSCIDNTV